MGHRCGHLVSDKLSPSSLTKGTDTNNQQTRVQFRFKRKNWLFCVVQMVPTTGVRMAIQLLALVFANPGFISENLEVGNPNRFLAKAFRVNRIEHNLSDSCTSELFLFGPSLLEWFVFQGQTRREYYNRNVYDSQRKPRRISRNKRNGSSSAPTRTNWIPSYSDHNGKILDVND